VTGTVFAVAVRVVCFTVRTACAAGVLVCVALVSVVDDWSVAAGADWSTVVAAGGVVAGAGVVTGAGSAGTGCTCCARAEVEESARAAAIAGRAQARIWCVLFLMWVITAAGARSGRVIARWIGNADERPILLTNPVARYASPGR
jgi:hypothetical protein